MPRSNQKTGESAVRAGREGIGGGIPVEADGSGRARGVRPRTELMPVTKRLPELLRRRRMALGLSQGQLAQLSGLKRQTIGLLESEGHVPTIEVLVRVCAALQTTLPELLAGGGEQAAF